MNEIILSLVNLSKELGRTDVIKNISLDIHKGEFLTLLGPSGCGKTTTLRLIAGLEHADSGKIILNGKDITDADASKRSVNTVFQNYALFPHMNIYDNIAYGLKIKNVDKREIKERVSEMLTLVKMEGLEKRMPNQLSGGQRQRIAIARALINKPNILLLDEPLGALDQKLRQHMQTELKNIQKQTGITFIYVTHDQEEALNMSDRLAVMNEGRFEQVDLPEIIYNHPKTKFVASFVGERNIIKAKVTEIHQDYAVADFNGCMVRCIKDGLQINDNIYICVHSDRVKLLKNLDETVPFAICGKVFERHYTGSQARTNIVTPCDCVIKAVEYNQSSFKEAEIMYVTWDIKNGIVIKGDDNSEQEK